jgi:hypothetical protein
MVASSGSFQDLLHRGTQGTALCGIALAMRFRLTGALACLCGIGQE